MRGDVVTLKRNAPAFKEMIPPGGAFPSVLGSANAGLRSTGHGGVPGHLLWQKETPLSYPEPIVVGPKERILFACNNGLGSNGGQVFVSYDAQGNLLWQMPLEKAIGFYCWLENGNALLFGASPQVYDVTPETSCSLVMVNAEGKEMWRWNQISLEGTSDASFLQTTSEGQVIAGNMNRRSIFSWKSNGELLWHLPAPLSYAIINFASDTKEHIFGVCRGRRGDGIFCIDKMGKALWKKELNISSMGVVDEDGNLRVVTYERQGTKVEYTLLCLNPKGDALWRTPPLNVEGSAQGPDVNIALSHNGRTIIRGVEEVLCVDKKGAVVWKTRIAESANRGISPWFGLVTSVDGYVYVNTSKGIYTLAPNGNILDILSLPEYTIRNITIVYKRLYVAGLNTFGPSKGHIWAYELQNPDD
jgi:hypothetical protein